MAHVQQAELFTTDDLAAMRLRIKRHADMRFGDILNIDDAIPHRRDAKPSHAVGELLQDFYATGLGIFALRIDQEPVQG